jgi:hypothetical protein
VLRVVCLLSAAVAVVLVVRRVLVRVDTLGRPRDVPVISVAVALAVAVASGVPVLRHARLEHRLSDVASSLSGTRVTVRCETLSQAWTDVHPEAGYVWFDADGRPATEATITVSTCDDLRRWVGSDHAAPTVGGVVAVHVLTHESMHLAGLRNEALAECAAVQRDARTAVLLGATPAQGAALATTYWRQVYDDLAPDYRTADCAPGGRLDEHLDSPPWT